MNFLLKVKVNRLVGMLSKCISLDTVGFVCGQSAVANIRKVLVVQSKLAGPSLSSNTLLEKAFDKVNCFFFRSYTLFTVPKAQIFMAGSLSALFQLQEVTCQGCPLLPLLYLH